MQCFTEPTIVSREKNESRICVVYRDMQASAYSASHRCKCIFLSPAHKIDFRHNTINAACAADRMSAENPDHAPDETTNVPLLVFLTSEICDAHFEMLAAYTQTHTLADFTGELEVAKAARALLRLVPDA